MVFFLGHPVYICTAINDISTLSDKHLHNTIQYITSSRLYQSCCRIEKKSVNNFYNKYMQIIIKPAHVPRHWNAHSALNLGLWFLSQNEYSAIEQYYVIFDWAQVCQVILCGSLCYVLFAFCIYSIFCLSFSMPM